MFYRAPGAGAVLLLKVATAAEGGTYEVGFETGWYQDPYRWTIRVSIADDTVELEEAEARRLAALIFRWADTLPDAERRKAWDAHAGNLARGLITAADYAGGTRQ